MQTEHIHIISFDIPYPADYGGIIDVYYKIKALYEAGIKIHLHCWEYGREQSEILNKICFSVTYYKRKTNILSGLSLLPYIVKSRSSKYLLNNLLQDNYPILFEGIHVCGVCSDLRIKKRFLILRPTNIEHVYYYNLAIAEKSLLKKAFFYLEALKLKRFEKKLQPPNLVCGISEADTNYFKTVFPKSKVEHIPGFHSGLEISSLIGKGTYALYHGNLEVPENSKSAIFLLKKVFAKIDYHLIVSGKNPSPELISLCKELKHVQIIKNPDEANLFQLIQNAHIHVLPTFQASGFKLKLIHTLFNGRHIIVNSKMINGTPFQSICHLAEEAPAWISQIEKLKELDFTSKDIAKRKALLIPNYLNSANAEKLKKLIFDSNIN